MPLISDPGYKLVKECRKNEIYVTVLPGATSVTTAIVLSGMPCDKFLFLGFVPHKHLVKWGNIEASLVFFESAKRIITTLKKMAQIFYNREVCIVREMTKIFENMLSGSFKELIETYEKTPPKGEIAIVLGPPNLLKQFDDKEINTALLASLQKNSLSKASSEIAAHFNMPKKEIYKHALSFLNKNHKFF